MKKIISTILATVLLLSTMLSVGYAAETKKFGDIDKSYAKDAILELQELGIIDGINDSQFNPSGKLTRAEFVAIMVRALGLEATATTSSFTDVTGWAIPYIEAAVKAGIVTGTGNGLFAPTAPLTREAAAVILVRSLQSKGLIDDTEVPLEFKDANKISNWAKKFVAIAFKFGLIKGNSDGTFNPTGTADRAMAAVMGSNLLTAIEEVVTPTPSPTPSPSPIPSPTPTPTPPPATGGGGGGGYVPPVVTLSSIAITTPATKLSYTVGDALSIAGMVVTGTYSNSTTATISVTVANVAGFNSAVAVASQTLTVTVGGKSTTYTVAITAPVVEPVLSDLTDYNAALSSVTESVYTADSWTLYLEVVDANVVTASNSQEEVDAATANIVEAQANLLVLNPPVDKISPVIELIGDASITVAFGVPYADEGVTISDEESGLVATVTFTLDGSAVGNIDTTVEGTYTIHYNVSDTAGNEATEVTRTLNVIGVTSGTEAEAFVLPQDFGYWSNIGDGRPGINVGFQLQLAELSYDNITKIEVFLVDENGEILGTRTATGTQIEQLQSDDATTGEEDGQLSVVFIKRSTDAVNAWWTSTPYDLTTPSAAVIVVTTNSHDTYIVGNSTLLGDPIPVPDSVAPIIGVHPTYGLSAQVYDGFGSSPDGFGDYIDTFLSVNEPLASLKVYAYAGDPGNINTPVVEVTGSIADHNKIELSTNYQEANDILGNESFPNSTEELDAFFRTLNFAVEPKVVITATDLAGNVSTTTLPLVLSGITPNPSLYVEMQDFGALVDDGFNLGFKLNLDNLGGYANIESITGIISDADGEVGRVAADNEERIGNYAADDANPLYGGNGTPDGQLSFDFRTLTYVTTEYGGTLTSYTNYIKPIDDLYTGTPTSAQIVIVTKSGAIITANR